MQWCIDSVPLYFTGIEQTLAYNLKSCLPKQSTTDVINGAYDVGVSVASTKQATEINSTKNALRIVLYIG